MLSAVDVVVPRCRAVGTGRTGPASSAAVVVVVVVIIAVVLAMHGWRVVNRRVELLHSCTRHHNIMHRIII